MKFFTIFISLVLTAFISVAQIPATADPIQFDSLIKHIKVKEYYFEKDSSILPVIYEGGNFKVAISNNPVAFTLTDTVLKGPVKDKYPLSYSVIFDDNLVTLFDPGHFVCYKLPTLERNKHLEYKLNTDYFTYHWLLNTELIGQTNDQNYFFNSLSEWEAYPEPVPLMRWPKLFEDSNYIIFSECHGEFGGAVYFFNKKDQNIHFTPATCANTVFKKQGKYVVLAHLGHMSGHSKLNTIEDPEKLPVIGMAEINKPLKKWVLRPTDSTHSAKNIFDFYGIQTFSSFTCNNKTLYLVNWREKTFIAEINGNTIAIVNPLFNDDLYTHQPVTTIYTKRTLINLDFYDIAGRREVAVLIIEGNKLTRIEWNEKQDH
jgi:hypothetical protein